MENNNHTYSVNYSAVKGSFEKNVYYNASLFDVNIVGNLCHNPQKPEWTVTARFLSDDEHDEITYQSSEPNAVIIEFDTEPCEAPGVSLLVKTMINEEFLPPIEDMESNACVFPLEIETCLPLEDSNELQAAEPSYENDEDYSFDILPEESTFELPLPVSSHLNMGVACLGDGFLKTSQDTKLPYFGEFLGIRMLYDLSKHEIIYISTDDGSADWYESTYKVIIYPTGLASCPILTVAICLWVADLSK
jgi:hypothetical protein